MGDGDGVLEGPAEGLSVDHVDEEGTEAKADEEAAGGTGRAEEGPFGGGGASDLGMVHAEGAEGGEFGATFEEDGGEGHAEAGDGDDDPDEFEGVGDGKGLAEDAEDLASEMGIGEDLQAGMAGAELGADSLVRSSLAQDEDEAGGERVAEPEAEMGAIDDDRAALVAVIGEDAGDLEGAGTGRGRDGKPVADAEAEAVEEGFADEGEAGVSGGVPDGVGGRAVAPGERGVAVGEGEFGPDEDRLARREEEAGGLDDVPVGHIGMGDHRPPGFGGDAVFGGSALGAVGGDVQIGLEGPFDPAAHGGVEGSDEDGHAGGHGDGAEEAGGGEAMAAGGGAEVGEGEVEGGVPPCERGEETGDGTEGGTGEDAAAEDGEEGGEVTGSGDAEAAGPMDGTEEGQADTGGGEGEAEAGGGPEGAGAELWGMSDEDLGWGRACGGTGGEPAGDEGREDGEGDGGEEFGGGERGGADAVGVVEGVDGAADEADGALGAGPAEEGAEEATGEPEEGSLGQPGIADGGRSDAEGPQDGDFLATADHGAIEGLEDEVEADQEGEQGKDGEVEAEGPGHDGAGLAAVGRGGDAVEPWMDAEEGLVEIGPPLFVVGARGDAEFDAADPVGAPREGLEGGEVEDEEGLGRVWPVGSGGDDSGDLEGDLVLVDQQGEGGARGELLAAGEGFGDVDRVWVGEGLPEEAERVGVRWRRGQRGGPGRGPGSGGGPGWLVEPRTLVVGGGCVLERDEVHPEEGEGGAVADGFVVAGARGGGGGFEDGEDLDGLGAEGGPGGLEEGVREVSGRSGEDPVAFLCDEFREVLEAGDGGAVGEADGEVNGDAEGDDEDEQGGLARVGVPMPQRGGAEEQAEGGGRHGAQPLLAC